MPENKQIHLVSRPSGEATAANFRMVLAQTPVLKDGQVLVRRHSLSLDPYMRGRMSEAESYAAPQSLGQTMSRSWGSTPASTTRLIRTPRHCPGR